MCYLFGFQMALYLLGIAVIIYYDLIKPQHKEHVRGERRKAHAAEAHALRVTVATVKAMHLNGGK